MTRLPTLGTALLMLVVLAACAPGAATPGAADTESAGPSPSPSTSLPSDAEDAAPTLGSRPDPRTDASCDSLVPRGSFDGLFGVPLTLVDETRTAERIGTVISAEWAVREAGGIACEWQDALSEVTSEGYFSYQGVRLMLLPATDAESDPYFAAAGGGRRFSQCTSDYYCHLEARTDTGWWFSLTAMYFPDENPGAAALEALEHVLDRVADLPRPAPATAPASGDAVAAACDQQITPVQAAAAFGTPGANVEVLGLYPSLWTSAEAAVGATECSWSWDYSIGATVTVLPGGEWAMDRAVAAYGPAERVPLIGSSSGGYLRPQVEAQGFDFAVDGDWIQITVPQGTTPPPRDVLVAFATAILANAR